MKFAAIAIAAGLALGTGAFAQTHQGSAPAKGESIGKKADRVFDRVEDATARGVDKVRNATRGTKREAKEETREARQDAREAKATREARRDHRDDTRAMGAGRAGTRPASSGDQVASADRQARMDEAYANWKRQQQR